MSASASIFVAISKRIEDAISAGPTKVQQLSPSLVHNLSAIYLPTLEDVNNTLSEMKQNSYAEYRLWFFDDSIREILVLYSYIKIWFAQ